MQKDTMPKKEARESENPQHEGVSREPDPLFLPENPTNPTKSNNSENEVGSELWIEEALAGNRVRDFITGKAHGAQREEQERTTRKKELFLEVYARTMGTITLACEKADIHRDTFYRWQKEDSMFRARVIEVERQRLGMVEDRLFKLIQQDDGPSVRYFLDRKHPEYKPKSETEIVVGERTFEDIMYEQAEKRKALSEKKENDSTQ